LPRKLRTPKHRRGSGIPVSKALFSFLVWGDYRAASALAEPGDSRWELFDGIGPHEHRAVWEAIVDEALDVWTRRHPGSRPPNWWQWTAPELRRIFGRFTVVKGHGRCQSTGVPFGSPDEWTDLPMVESTPAYLDRLALWLDGERDRVPACDFDPQPFSWNLTGWSADGDEEDDR
jgi:hypothetical protein